MVCVWKHLVWMNLERREPGYVFIRERSIDTCQSKIREMDQLALDMEKILNKKTQELQKMGKKMEISTLMTTIKEKLKDELWKC